MPGMRGRTSTSFCGSIVPVATTMRSMRARSAFAVRSAGGASPPHAAQHATNAGKARARSDEGRRTLTS